MAWIKLIDLPNQKVDSQEYDFNYWKIENGFVWHQGRKLRSADIKTFEVRKDYSQIFIARDKNNIYHAWSKLTKIDRNTFQSLQNGYWKDEHNSYSEFETSIKPMKGNDVKNFKVLGGGWACDSNFAYYWGKAIKSCKKTLSLQLIGKNLFYAKDDENIYFDGAVLKNSDTSTWKELGKGFSLDKKSIYFGAKKLPSAKIESWKRVSHPYSLDEKHVYIMYMKLKGANPNTWKKLNQSYSKDDKNVYFVGRLINGVDATSFRILSNDQGKDKNGLIYRDSPQI
jgi:hypothetical protein